VVAKKKASKKWRDLSAKARARMTEKQKADWKKKKAAIKRKAAYKAGTPK
jgi:hypothetical protein